MVNLTPEERKLKTIVQGRIGEHLRAIRINKKMRQKEVADLCGFSRSGYNLIEQGQRNLTIFSLYKISKVLEEPLENLVKISDIDKIE
ncbi:helix-turn-helix transcriptional regulator [Tamlana sp. 2201CG12-4]|uniref:helix-turn-helix domain-containing protein n=1 Tax=Tamlana sp. 2201CG12-4 TaxID=3112582 RepID=UPI002DBACF80|nr:helix-turn-helix transcriptional regulator [Tamlana sp. 2201CG12-4]MEC3908200.1 helix-turn-helix transcriptional regulator [Tamlana sp. 2201CG12-4]